MLFPVLPHYSRYKIYFFCLKKILFFSHLSRSAIESVPDFFGNSSRTVLLRGRSRFAAQNNSGSGRRCSVGRRVSGRCSRSVAVVPRMSEVSADSSVQTFDRFARVQLGRRVLFFAKT